jgi:hypothetical protein
MFSYYSGYCGYRKLTDESNSLIEKMLYPQHGILETRREPLANSY